MVFTVPAMEKKIKKRKTKNHLSTKLEPSEKFLTSNPDQIDYFASLPIELITIITMLLLDNPQCKTYPTRSALIDALQNVTSLALLNKLMQSIFLSGQSDFAKQTTAYFLQNIIDNTVTWERVVFPKKNFFKGRERLIVPFLKQALQNLRKQHTINEDWKMQLKHDPQEALKLLDIYQEINYAPQIYEVFGLQGCTFYCSPVLFTIFFKGVEQKKIHYNSCIRVNQFYSWHTEKRSHYCTILSLALDLFRSSYKDRSLEFIKLLLEQGADPHKVCTIPLCNYPTPWQDAQAIGAEYPEVLALLNPIPDKK